MLPAMPLRRRISPIEVSPRRQSSISSLPPHGASELPVGCRGQRRPATRASTWISVLSYEGPALMRYGSHGPARNMPGRVLGDGSVLPWLPRTVDECDRPYLFFRRERIHGSGLA
jgi:hypothetical protein